ncbi:MAG TPA: DUF4239 domain-containing protein [Verrucomicrobiae bacterium]|jgi:hypothetical protein
MNVSFIALLTILGMIVGTLGMLEVGRRVGRRRMESDPESAKASTGTIDGAIFGLLGLLIAFTFSGAASRFDERRAMIVEEANCIGTAWLRLDLLPAAAQPPLREKFRQYLDARLSAFQKIPDFAAATADFKRASTLQTEIWTQGVAACRDSGSQPVTMLLLPALNQMFDIATSRTAGTQRHPPTIIYVLLGLLLLAAALLAGVGLSLGRVRSWFHGLAFVLVMTLTVYVIVDFEFPRIGIIRIHGFEQVLVDLRQDMNAPQKP